MKLSYERDMTHNYMIPEQPAEAKENDYRSRMLVENQIPGLLPCHIELQNCQSRFVYDITSKQSMERVCEQRLLGEQDLRCFFDGFYRMLKEIQKYLLDMDMVLLEPQTIYLDIESKQPSFCFLPGHQGDLRRDLLKLAEYFLEHIDQTDDEAVLFAYQIFRNAGEESSCLEEILKRTLLQDSRRRTYSYGEDEREMEGQTGREIDRRTGRKSGGEHGREYDGDTFCEGDRNFAREAIGEGSGASFRDGFSVNKRKQGWQESVNVNFSDLESEDAEEAAGQQENSRRMNRKTERNVGRGSRRGKSEENGRKIDEKFLTAEENAWNADEEELASKTGKSKKAEKRKQQKISKKQKQKTAKEQELQEEHKDDERRYAKDTKDGKNSGKKFVCVCLIFAIILSGAAAWMWGLSTTQIGGIIFLLTGLLIYGLSYSGKQKKKAKEKENKEDDDLEVTILEPEYEMDGEAYEAHEYQRRNGRKSRPGIFLDSGRTKEREARYEEQSVRQRKESVQRIGQEKESLYRAGQGILAEKKWEYAENTRRKQDSENRSGSIPQKQENRKLGDTGVLYEETDLEPTLALISADPRCRDATILKKTSYIIGKLASQSDIVLTDPLASRIHAKIERRDRDYYLSDLNSTNGTFLNGRRLNVNETAEIHAADEIAFARTRYYVGKC